MGIDDLKSRLDKIEANLRLLILLHGINKTATPTEDVTTRVKDMKVYHVRTLLHSVGQTPPPRGAGVAKAALLEVWSPEVELLADVLERG